MLDEELDDVLDDVLDEELDDILDEALDDELEEALDILDEELDEPALPLFVPPESLPPPQAASESTSNPAPTK